MTKATIDYKPYFKMFTDLQRTGDLSLGNVEISECIIKIKEKQKKNTSPSFRLYFRQRFRQAERKFFQTRLLAYQE